MNLLETIELLAGGPGSGCHGPNCGRPEGHEGEHSPTGIISKVAYSLRDKGKVNQKRGSLADFTRAFAEMYK